MVWLGVFYSYWVYAENSIIIGSNKFNNTYENKGAINYKMNTYLGDFEINTNYLGTIITNIHNVFRDVADANFNYKYIVLDNIYIISETKYNLISDKSDLLNNKLEKKSEQLGISGMLFDKLFIKAISGIQYNKQSDLKSIGSLTNTSLLLNNVSFDNWKLASEINTEHLLLNDERSTIDINAISKLWKQFSNNDFLNLELKYKKRYRDFLHQISNTKNYVTEANNENRIEGNIVSNFELFNDLFVNIKSNIARIDIERKYKEQIATISNSKLGKNYNEWLANVDINIDYKHNIFSHNIGLKLDNREEHYYLQNIYNLQFEDFNNEQLIESQKDNNTFNIKVFYNPTIIITKRNFLLANIILTKTEYNTPSSLNNDERDVLNHIFSLEYRRESSKILTIISKINYLQNHIVFIHQERSIQNNWNRIISYQNGIVINAYKFFYSPQFEVLANYTIYDYETFSQSIRSYSIRQISYKDSLSVLMFNNLSLTNKIYFRYYEQSKLFWNTFSELPQRKTTDITSLLMCSYNLNNAKRVGIGMRLYYLNIGIINMNNNNNVIYSYSPEALFNFKISKWEFFCNAWCEFRNENKIKKIIPHFTINTGYTL